MKFGQQINEKYLFNSSSKQEIDDDKTILVKEYEIKLHNIAFEVDRLTSQLKEKNRQLENQREFYKDSYLFSMKCDQQVTNINNSFQQLRNEFQSPMKNEITLRSIDQPSYDEIKEISELQRENNQLKNSQMQYETEVQTLRKYIQQIQNNFELYQNEINQQKIKMQQQIKSVEQDQKQITQTIALATELSNLIKVVQSKNEEIREIKFKNEQLEKKMQQQDREKSALEAIISIQASQIESKKGEQEIKRNILLPSNSSTTLLNVSQQLKYQSKEYFQNQLSNQEQDKGAKNINIPQFQKELQPINIIQNDCQLRQGNHYYLVTPKSNITNNQSDFTGRTTQKAEDFINMQKSDFTRASQYYFNNGRQGQTPNSRNDYSSSSRLDLSSKSLSPIGKTQPKIINLSQKNTTNEQ